MDEQSIFLEALEKKTPETLAAWLDSKCGGDVELRERIEALLSCHHKAGGLLDQPIDEMQPSLQLTATAAISSDQASVLRSIGQRFGEIKGVALQDAEDEFEDSVVQPSSRELPKSVAGSRYQFLGEIARGGMGAVIKGRDTDLGRDLAVKVLLDEHKDNPEIIRRFVEEAQIGGQLQHPGIAPIYELGQFGDQRPFFTMKLVKGKTLAELLSQRETPEQEQSKLLGIFEQICQTMAYAHSRRVIHRDLKPSNIMVGAFGEVQVMDWGLAKVLDAGGIADETKAARKRQEVSVIETVRSSGSNTFDGFGSQTRAGSVMGTPAYMPPEQAMGDAEALDKCADVFGLGAILCEILTGDPPYLADHPREVLRKAARADLAECHQRLNDCQAHPELIELTRKCLAPEPARRFQDAGAVAEQLTSHLESVVKKLRQAELRRKLTYVVAASLLLLVSGLGIGGVWLQAQKAMAANQIAEAERQHAQEAQENNQELQQALYASSIQLASSELLAGNVRHASEILRSQVPSNSVADRRGFEWYFLDRLCLRRQQIGRATWANQLGSWHARSNKSDGLSKQVTHDWKRHLQLSLVRKSENEILRHLIVRDADSGAEIWSTDVSRGQNFNHADSEISAGGQAVVFYAHAIDEDYHEVIPFDIWDIESGKHHRIELRDVELGIDALGTDHYLKSALSPNGKYYAVELPAYGSTEKATLIEKTTLTVWEIGRPEPLHSTTLNRDWTRGNGMKFSPDGSKLLLTSVPAERYAFTGEAPENYDEGNAGYALLDTQTGKQLHQTLVEDMYFVGNGTFSPDGSMFAATGANFNFSEHPISDFLWIWDTESGKKLCTIGGRIGAGNSILFSPDGTRICLSTGQIYETRSGAFIGKLEQLADIKHVSPINRLLKFAPDGESILGVTANGNLVQWRLPADRFKPKDFPSVGEVFVSSDGTMTGRILPSSADESGDSIQIYTIDRRSNLLEIPSKIFRSGGALNSHSAAFSTDGRQVAVMTRDAEHDESFQFGRRRRRHQRSELKLWEIETGKLVGTLWSSTGLERVDKVKNVHNRGLIAAATSSFLPDRDLINQKVMIFDLATMSSRIVLEIERKRSQKQRPLDPFFSRDGKTFVVETTDENGADRQLEFYSVDTGERLEQFPIPSKIPAVLLNNSSIFDPTGTMVALPYVDRNCIDIYDVNSGKLRHSLKGMYGTNPIFTWSSQGDRIIAYTVKPPTRTGQLMVWDIQSGNQLLAHQTQAVPLSPLTLLPGGNEIICWYTQGVPKIWDARPRSDE